MKPMDLHRLMMSRGNPAEIEQTMERMGVDKALRSDEHSDAHRDAGSNTTREMHPDAHTPPGPHHGG
jgi:hypothetical protein